MAEMCSKCGLPTELCVCEDVSKSESTVDVFVQERSYDKEMTIISNIPEDIDKDALSSRLKSNLACGGGVIDDDEYESAIQLQGNHIKHNNIVEMLEDEGFDVRID
jgi:translation initiation factor 1